MSQTFLYLILIPIGILYLTFPLNVHFYESKIQCQVHTGVCHPEHESNFWPAPRWWDGKFSLMGHDLKGFADQVSKERDNLQWQHFDKNRP